MSLINIQAVPDESGHRASSPSQFSMQALPIDSGTNTLTGESEADVSSTHALALVADKLMGHSVLIELNLADDQSTLLAPFDRALRTAQAEPLFDVLERWLGVEFDVTPIEDEDKNAMASDHDRPPLRLRLMHRCSDQSIVVHLPHSMLGSLPMLNRSITSDFDIRMAQSVATCRVARLSISHDALESLTPGAIILMPASFAAHWTVHLLSQGFTAAAHLDVETSSISIQSGELVSEQQSADQAQRQTVASDDDARQSIVDIVLDAALFWNPMAVLGGSGAKHIDLPDLLAESAFLCLINGREALQGQVTKVGDGYGFLAGDPQFVCTADAFTEEPISTDEA